MASNSNKLLIFVFSVTIVVAILSNLDFYLGFGKYLRIMENAYSQESITALQETVDGNYTYEELMNWVRKNLDFDKTKNKFPRYAGPINVLIHGVSVPQKILEGGIGRCEEFSVVFVAVCVAHGYDARLVRSVSPGDHMWAEVLVDDEWIHVDPSDGVFDDPFRYFRGDYILEKIIAYGRNRYVEVTEKYIPK